jgi:hypothetical protein
MSPAQKGKKLTIDGNSQEQFEKGLMNQSLDYGRAVTDMNPEERQFLGELSQKGEAADAGVVSEMDALRARGEDLSNVDEAYMERAYKPAYERLMESYQNMDQDIIENMNSRGIAATGSSADNGSGQAGSEPEAYQRMLLARDTKNQLSRNMLEAQNQAVQQKLAQYQGRLAETEQANTRFGQVQAPVIGANVTSATDRLNARTGAATQNMATRFGYAGQMHKINSDRQAAGQERMLAGVGIGVGALSDIASAVAGAGAKK